MNSNLVSALVLSALLAGSVPVKGADQPCTPESVRSVRGSWSRTADVIVGPVISAYEVQALLGSLQAYHDLLQKALPSPEGFNVVSYSSVRGDPLVQNGPQAFEATAGMYRLVCTNGTVGMATEYAGQMAIMANDVWHMSGIGRFDIGGKKALALGSPIGSIRGYPAFEPEFSSPLSGTINVYEWVVLVARPGQSPFRYVTRKEMLDHMRAVCEKDRVQALAIADEANPIRPQAVQDAAKAKGLQEWVASAKDEQQRQRWTERYLSDYRTDEQKRAAARAKTNAGFDAFLARLKTIESRYGAAQLQEPALLNDPTATLHARPNFDFAPPKGDRHTCTISCGGPHGKPLVVADERYFHGTAARSAPQFFTVSFRWSAPRQDKYRDAKFEQVRDDFFKGFDFSALAGMLAK